MLCWKSAQHGAGYDVDLPQDNVRKDMEYDVGDQNPGDHPLYFCLFQFNGKEHRHDCCD